MSYINNHLSDKEQGEIKSLCRSNPLIKKIVDEIESFYDDPSKMLYKEIVETTKTLSNDLSLIRSGKDNIQTVILNDDKDDKLFDRIMNLITKSGPIFEGIAKGKKMIDPIGAKQESMKDDGDKVIF